MRSGIHGGLFPFVAEESVSASVPLCEVSRFVEQRFVQADFQRWTLLKAMDTASRSMVEGNQQPPLLAVCKPSVFTSLQRKMKYAVFLDLHPSGSRSFWAGERQPRTSSSTLCKDSLQSPHDNLVNPSKSPIIHHKTLLTSLQNPELWNAQKITRITPYNPRFIP